MVAHFQARFSVGEFLHFLQLIAVCFGTDAQTQRGLSGKCGCHSQPDFPPQHFVAGLSESEVSQWPEEFCLSVKIE